MLIEKLIETYLLRNHYCPLPKLGTLTLHEINANIETINKKIEAPKTEIRFEKNHTSDDDFIQFIAKKKSVKYDEAKTLLGEFCNKIYSLNNFSEKKINHSGLFYIDTDGVLSFRQNEIAIEFLPVVEAKRVTHPDQSHIIRVGDQERKAIFKKSKSEKTGKSAKKLWWISAIVLFLLSIGICIYAYQKGYKADFWNNKTKIKPANSVKTYRVIQ
jgi:preprotein translocase subunit SecG